MMNKKVIAVALALALAGGSYAQDDTAKKKVKAYMVSDAHLDTQVEHGTSRQQSTNMSGIPLSQNLFLLKKYPEYVFNFEGGVKKYAWMKEYYPEQYEEMKKFIEEGRWHIAGSSWEASRCVGSFRSKPPSVTSCSDRRTTGKSSEKKERISSCRTASDSDGRFPPLPHTAD